MYIFFITIFTIWSRQSATITQIIIFCVFFNVFYPLIRQYIYIYYT
jgi:hypothetical protein